jgi:hypothetical protein
MACWTSDGAGFPVQRGGPDWSDANGWNDLAAYGSIRFAGGRAADDGGGDTGGDTADGDTADDSDVTIGDEDGVADLPGEAGSPGSCGCAAGAPGKAVGGALLAGFLAAVRGGRRARRDDGAVPRA